MRSLNIPTSEKRRTEERNDIVSGCIGIISSQNLGHGIAVLLAKI